MVASKGLSYARTQGLVCSNAVSRPARGQQSMSDCNSTEWYQSAILHGGSQLITDSIQVTYRSYRLILIGYHCTHCYYHSGRYGQCARNTWMRHHIWEEDLDADYIDIVAQTDNKSNRMSNMTKHHTAGPIGFLI